MVVLLLFHLLLDLREVGVASSLVVRRASLHSPIPHEDDVISQSSKFDGVSSHEYGLPPEMLFDCLLHDAGCDVDVHCADDIVE